MSTLLPTTYPTAQYNHPEPSLNCEKNCEHYIAKHCEPKKEDYCETEFVTNCEIVYFQDCEAEKKR